MHTLLWLFLSYNIKSPGVINALNTVFTESLEPFNTKYVLSALNI